MPVLRKVRATLGDCYRDKIRRDVPILAFHRIRKGDGELLQRFSDEDDLADRRPDLFDKYQELLDVDEDRE